MRLSDKILPTNYDRPIIYMPTQQMIEHAKENNKQMYLAGFTNNNGNNCFNFILNTGQQTDQKDEGKTYTKMMLPDGAHLKIRKVVVYIYNKVSIAGFKFMDIDGAIIFEVGCFDNISSTTDVLVN